MQGLQTNKLMGNDLSLVLIPPRRPGDPHLLQRRVSIGEPRPRP
ncbi:hypothetical protein P4234_24290 [Pseudomonas aeruginosa]|nr:hypothetical protein [Pseudomonas aeruginosa]